MTTLDGHLDQISRHLDDLRAQLEEWQAAIEAFKSRADERKATSSGEYKLRELVLMREDTDQRLAQTRDKLNDAWDNVQECLHESWNEVKEEFKRAREKGTK